MEWPASQEAGLLSCGEEGLLGPKEASSTG
jgi:hypothetical protein